MAGPIVKDAIADDSSSTRLGQTSEATIPQTQRGLSPRHVQLMTIAGGIGVGLFVGVGGVLSKAGPLPLIIGYIIYGVGFIWPTTLNVAEMVAWLPIRGSIYELAARFVDPALGFAMGWTYFFAGAMLVCTEYSAVATVMGYWNVDVNPAVWIALVLAVCYFLNMAAVKWFGENGATGVFLSVCISVRYAAFTIGGPDTISLAAGEIQNPRKTIPRVSKMIINRILFFYIFDIYADGRKQAVDHECRLWEEDPQEEHRNEELGKKNVILRTWDKVWGDY
ncbi:Proline-specific permease [Colletotrichum sp. SAR11_239]|nr:Proline-specific permease [Colletotrichum sp. SAR11_239]